MPAIITNKFRVHNAEQFKESFGESADTYYLGIGRPQAFADNQAFNDGTDTNPPTPNDDTGSEFYTYDDLLSAKKIASSDVTTVIPRINWTSGTVYDYYRHDYSINHDLIKQILPGLVVQKRGQIIKIMGNNNQFPKYIFYKADSSENYQQVYQAFHQNDNTQRRSF